MFFEILYYRGVQEEISAWDKTSVGRYVRIADMIEKSGPNLGRPYTRKIEDGIIEIKAARGRAFFCAEEDRKIIILDTMIASEKSGNKIPVRKLKTIRKRRKDWKDNLEPGQ